MSVRGQACAYCGKPAVHEDHLISKNQARRRVEAQRARENPRYKVPACKECNWRRLTLCLVPKSHAHLISELEEITFSKYRTWNGDPTQLYEATA